MRWRRCGDVSFGCCKGVAEYVLTFFIDEGHVKDSANAKMLTKFRPDAVRKVLAPAGEEAAP